MKLLRGDADVTGDADRNVTGDADRDADVTEDADRGADRDFNRRREQWLERLVRRQARQHTSLMLTVTDSQ